MNKSTVLLYVMSIVFLVTALCWSSYINAEEVMPNINEQPQKPTGALLDAITLHDCYGEPHWLVVLRKDGVEIFHASQVPLQILEHPNVKRLGTPGGACL